MNVLVDYNQIEDEGLKNAISEFLSEMRDNFPELFNSLDMKIVQHTKYAEAYFQLNSQIMIEELTDRLAKELGCHILYAIKMDGDKSYKVVAYSTPIENKMFIVYLNSQQYGVLDSITVHFHESLDCMYKQISGEYASIPKRSVFVLEKEKYSDMVKCFF